MVIRPGKPPYLVYSDEHDNLFEDSSLLATGRSGNRYVVPATDELIELPEGSDFFHLPGRVPIGYDTVTKNFRPCNKGFAVAAFVTPAYSQLYFAAWKNKKNAPLLPLFAYTAIGWLKNKFYTTALRIDPDIRQDCNQFNQKLVEQGVSKLIKKFPENRLLQHIAHCATVYYCPAARNYFLFRWEAPFPTSPRCNSQCLGCISYQPKKHNISATQNRIAFIPTPEEIAEIAIPHLENAPNPIVSFGQGCEGEPLLAWGVIMQAIIEIRKHTTKGIINLNTNASMPHAIERLCKSGLDSIRVSLNSARKKFYDLYYKPKKYSFNDVLQSIQIARQFNCWVSLNYFVFPGLTDEPDEYKALRNIIKKYKINMLQWRNFNIDPDWYISHLGYTDKKQGIGIRNLISKIKDEFPYLYHGYFNPGRNIIMKYKK
ncbi:MAG: radical SAM protein [Bacteroidia bacterium]|nr:radical SAM protein [Bacteroidia bacterium]